MLQPTPCRFLDSSKHKPLSACLLCRCLRLCSRGHKISNGAWASSKSAFYSRSALGTSVLLEALRQRICQPWQPLLCKLKSDPSTLSANSFPEVSNKWSLVLPLQPLQARIKWWLEESIESDSGLESSKPISL